MAQLLCNRTLWKLQESRLTEGFQNHIATVDKKNVNLTLKEYEVLCLLLKNSGTVLSRTQLLNQVWGYEFDGESRTVDVHIRTLRQKLGSAGELVETVRGVGYKINMK